MALQSDRVAVPEGKQAGLQNDGSILVPALGAGTAFEVSAPLTPCSIDLAEHTGTHYPFGAAAKRDALASATIPFGYFLEACASDYPDITLPGGRPLDDQTLRRNIAATELCMVERFGVRGQWVPELIQHIDVCEKVLGAPWHVPGTREMAAWAPEQVRFLKAAADMPGLWRYGTLRVYAMDTLYVWQSTLGLGSFRPPLTIEFMPDPPDLVSPSKHNQPTNPLELAPDNVVVRCVRPARAVEERRQPQRGLPAAAQCAERMPALIRKHPAMTPERVQNRGQMELDVVRAFDIFSAVQVQRRALDSGSTLRWTKRIATAGIDRLPDLAGMVNRGRVKAASRRLLRLARQQCADAGPEERARLAEIDPLLRDLASGKIPRDPSLPDAPYPVEIRTEVLTSSPCVLPESNAPTPRPSSHR